MTQSRVHLDTLFARWDLWLSLLAVGVGLVLLLTTNLAAIGGAVFGAGFSSVVAIVGGHGYDEDLRRKLDGALLKLDGALPAGAFETTERLLAPYRKIFHYYYTTQVNGTSRWYHATLDFSKDFAPGKLQASYAIRGRTYFVEGFLKRDCLILALSNPLGDHERQAINVFPDFAKHSRDTSFGVSLHETWDPTNEVGRGILALQPFVEAQADGFVEDTQKARELQKRWDKAMQQLAWGLFPNIAGAESLLLEQRQGATSLGQSHQQSRAFYEAAAVKSH